MVRWRPTTEELSSASRLRALASSTGWTSLRNARAKTPLTARSIPFSKRPRTPIASLPPALAGVPFRGRPPTRVPERRRQPNVGYRGRLHRTVRANLDGLARVAEQADAH